MDIVLRSAKRLTVLLPLFLVLLVGATGVFPPVNSLIPSNTLAVLVTYLITAYIVVPAIIRLLRAVVPARHVPLYCTTPDGFASDPINIGIYATKHQLETAMRRAGWHKADKRSFKSLFTLLRSLLLKLPYPNAPFSSLYLFGRSQDVGFQLPISNHPGHRHHVRFWAASHTGDPRHLDHISFWENFQRSSLMTGKVLWVGAASRDVGIGVIRHNAQFTHRIHPDTDSERDLIIKHLSATGLLKAKRSVRIGTPYRLTNRVISGYFQADGTMTICEL